MIKQLNKNAKAMEFTSFTKKDHVSDDELIRTVMQFENAFLSNQKGIVFHCLVRNLNNNYANVLFVEDMEVLKEMEKTIQNNTSAQDFFDLIKTDSVQMNFQTIEKENFSIPKYFSCIEYGSFSLKDKSNYQALLNTSNTIETEYLFKASNTQAHFIGKIAENRFSEVTLGNTLGKTKEICFGYTENEYCKPMLEMADDTTMELDFWYLIA
ncbi:hypothetical protein [Snuella sedimenti]|uniref:Uncharacterized protein n=1 Tax=Snuella sedimenti TaxID=2798802 RepID=A0A8J7J3S7_9FLAO|nr:hypothetical protein [Snuella sedimenti]MBJ6367928.1 hypothetical protein [Snuella sedimenti]